MTEYTDIVKQAQKCKNNVKIKYKLGISTKWSYYFAKAIQKPKSDVKHKTFIKAIAPNGTHISQQIKQAEYLKLAKQLTDFVEKHYRMPNYIKYGKYKIKPKLYTIFFARIIVSYHKNGKLPDKANINSKWFKKPVETTNEVYNYFVKTFGKVGTIDEALAKINGKGYGHYFDDKLSNKEVIDGLAHKTSNRPNCTDVSQMLWNIAIALGYEVRCIHVYCTGSGEGHVRLQLKHNKNTGGNWINRDGACVVSDNGKPITSIWCENGKLIDTNPNWFMDTLNK